MAVSSYIVVLEENVRDEQAEHTLNAIRMVKGVLSVVPNQADLVAEIVAEERLRTELLTKVIDLFKRRRS